MAYAGVKITANSSDYQAQMKSAANAMKVLSAEYTSAAAQAKAYGKETDGLKVKAESLTQKITVQSKIVQMNGEQQERLTKKLSEQKDEQEKLKAKIEKAAEKKKTVTKSVAKKAVPKKTPAKRTAASRKSAAGEAEKK